ncbi:hypothetical protein V5799_033973 [Amblyomma americanum]|uniref:Uncharacterized protein n=1 Tax=Amblyomma americanum TaxID=6943 RepID=A0AAQ4DLS9_AMBAM
MCFIRSSHRRLCCTRFVCTTSVASGPDACPISACSHGPSISPTASDYSAAKRSGAAVCRTPAPCALAAMGQAFHPQPAATAPPKGRGSKWPPCPPRVRGKRRAPLADVLPGAPGWKK